MFSIGWQDGWVEFQYWNPIDLAAVQGWCIVPNLQKYLNFLGNILQGATPEISKVLAWRDEFNDSFCFSATWNQQVQSALENASKQ